MMYLRAPNGLGDAIYLRAVVLHLLKRGEQITVFTRWNDVFSDLPVSIKPYIQITGNEDLRHVAYGSPLPMPKDADDFIMRCRQAGINEEVELRMDWKVRNQPLLDKIKCDAAGRKIFVYQCPRQVRSPASELLKPRREAFNKFIVDHSEYYRIKIGHPPHVEDDKDAQCELDMFGKAFIFDTFDIGTIGDLFFGQASFINVMAECLDKPYVCMFARAAMRSAVPQANAARPERTFHKKHLATAVYDDVA